MFQEGQLFVDVNEFKNILRDYIVLDGYKLKRDKNKSERVIVYCFGQ